MPQQKSRQLSSGKTSGSNIMELILISPPCRGCHAAILPFPKPGGQSSRKSLNRIRVSQARASDAPSHSPHQPPLWMSQGLGGIYFLIPGVPRRHSGSLDLGTKAGPTSVQCQ